MRQQAWRSPVTSFRYWVYRGSVDEGLAWYDTLLQRAGAVEQAPRAQLHASFLANYGGHPTVSRRFAEQSLEAYRRRGDAHGVALATGVLGDLDLRGSLEESVRRSREAAATLESIGDSYFLCYVLTTSPPAWLNSATWPRPSAPSAGRLPSPASTATRTGWRWGSGSWQTSFGFGATWSPPIASLPSPIPS